MPVTAVNGAGERAAGKAQQGLVSTFGWTLGIPVAGMREDTLYQATAEQAQDIDLVRRLAVDDTAASGRVEFVGTPGTVQEVGVIESRQHAHRAETPALDQRARVQHGQIETVTVSDHHLHPGGCDGIHHLCALLQRDGHGLFDQQVFARRRSQCHVLGVQTMRRGNVDHVHPRIVAERLHAGVGGRAKVLRKTRARRRLRISRGDQTHARIGDKGGQHQRESPAQAGYADAQRVLVHRSKTSSVDRARETQTMI